MRIGVAGRSALSPLVPWLAAMALTASDEAAASVPGATEAEIQRAVVSGDQDVLETARSRLRSQGAPECPATEPLSLRAYVAWRLSYFHERSSARSQALLAEAQQDLERVLACDPDDAEALALLGSVLGSRIGDLWSGLRRGPRAGRALDRALALAPGNPRVVMLLGISRLYRPRPLGGGIERAEQELQRACELFAREPIGQPWPNWGRAEVLAWRGQAALRRGDLDRAAAFYRDALEVEPDYHWVRRSLLPELEEKRMARPATAALAPAAASERVLATAAASARCSP